MSGDPSRNGEPCVNENEDENFECIDDIIDNDLDEDDEDVEDDDEVDEELSQSSADRYAF